MKVKENNYKGKTDKSKIKKKCKIRAQMQTGFKRKNIRTDKLKINHKRWGQTFLNWNLKRNKSNLQKNKALQIIKMKMKNVN